MGRRLSLRRALTGTSNPKGNSVAAILRSVRVLVSSVPTLGHFNPLRPLARHLQATGHDVVWGVAPDVCDQLQSEGFVARPAGPPMTTWHERLAARTRGQPGEGIHRNRLTYWVAPRLWGEVGASLMIDELLVIARDVQPDVVLFESRTYAAAAVARVVDALPVYRSVMMLTNPDVEQLVSEAVTPLWCELGLDPPTYGGIFDGVALSGHPATLDDASVFPGVSMYRVRPVPGGELSSELQSWVHDQRGRPLIYATLGTVFNSSVELFRSIIDALLELDVSLLLTVGPTGTPASLERTGTHLRVEHYVEQDALLPHCAAAISHGGSGTMLGALAQGVPHVMLPQGADQFRNAAVCESYGFGTALLDDSPSPTLIGTALSQILADPTFARTARALGDEMARGLTLDTTVSVIEDARRQSR